MTLEEFQTRIRAICAAHVERAKAAEAAFGEAIDQLALEAKGLIETNKDMVEHIMFTEVNSMVKRIG